MDDRTILCLNSGSSSLKFALYRTSERDESSLAQDAVEYNPPAVRLWLQAGDRVVDKTSNEPFNP